MESGADRQQWRGGEFVVLGMFKMLANVHLIFFSFFLLSFFLLFLVAANCQIFFLMGEFWLSLIKHHLLSITLTFVYNR